MHFTGALYAAEIRVAYAKALGVQGAQTGGAQKDATTSARFYYYRKSHGVRLMQLLGGRLKCVNHVPGQVSAMSPGSQPLRVRCGSEFRFWSLRRMEDASSLGVEHLDGRSSW
jgi:hypothetical protein